MANLKWESAKYHKQQRNFKVEIEIKKKAQNTGPIKRAENKKERKKIRLGLPVMLGGFGAHKFRQIGAWGKADRPRDQWGPTLFQNLPEIPKERSVLRSPARPPARSLTIPPFFFSKFSRLPNGALFLLSWKRILWVGFSRETTVFFPRYSCPCCAGDFSCFGLSLESRSLFFFYLFFWVSEFDFQNDDEANVLKVARGSRVLLSICVVIRYCIGLTSQRVDQQKKLWRWQNGNRIGFACSRGRKNWEFGIGFAFTKLLFCLNQSHFLSNNTLN